MSRSKVQDGMVVLEFACKRMRKMMRGNSECNSFEGVLGNLGLLSYSTENAIMGLVHMKNIHESAAPPPHMWNTVRLAAWILAMAEFLRCTNPKKVSIVEDMLFHRGDADTPASSIRLPSAGELRMIIIIALYYTAVSKKMDVTDAVESLLGQYPMNILIYMERIKIKRGIFGFIYLADAGLTVARFDEMIAAYECTKCGFDFMLACKTIDLICNSKFLFAFSVEAINVRQAITAPQTNNDIIRSLEFCLHGLKVQGELPSERRACISYENALQTLQEFKWQDIGSLNLTVRALYKRSKRDKDLMQVRSKQLLASIQSRIE